MLLFVPTPIGNLQDITYRAVSALRDAQVILAEDTRVVKKLLHLLSDRLGIEFGYKEILSFHEHNQERFLSNVEPSFFDRVVVYVSDAGMPGISDPGASLVRYAQEHSIPYEVLPGANAALTAWVASGYEGEFTFFGFLPHKKERATKLQEVLSNPYHSILYEAPHRLLKLLNEIVQLEPERELFLAKELTKKYERFYKASAKELFERLKNEQIRGEWVVILTPGSPKPQLDLSAIYRLDMPTKQKAKLLSQLTGESAKTIYEKLIND